MSDTYAAFMFFMGDPIVLAVLSFIVAWVVVVGMALAKDRAPVTYLEEAPAKPKNFFDQITEYHHEL